MRRLPKTEKIEHSSGQHMSKTLIAAYLVLGIVVWQIIQTSSGNGLSLLPSKKAQAGSTKWHMDREIRDSKKLRAAADPISAFVERAKRGMTEQEIRVIIADYDVMEMNPYLPNVVEYRAYVKGRHDWFVSALADGLSLDFRQKQMARAKLTESLNQTIGAPNNIPDPNNNAVLALSAHGISNESLYTNRWDLCDLTEAQLQLTYKKFQEIEQQKLMEEIRFNFIHPNNTHSTRCHLPLFLTMLDPASGELIEYPPPSDLNLASSVEGAVSGGIINVSNTFPLTPDQKLENHRGDILAQAKLLHPAQLRMALLMNHGVAQTLKYDLDKTDK